MRSIYLLIMATLTATLLTGCGTLTGIPSHGGGKRFAVEQELISASARACAKDLDLTPLTGRNVALFVTVIGDEGSGTMTGGRYTLDALLRGDYTASPTQTTQSTYSSFPSDATTFAPLDVPTSHTEATSVLNAPSQSQTRTEGSGHSSSVGLRVGGTGDYRNETQIQNPRDVTYLTNLLQTIFFLRGIDVVPPSQADTDVFVTVDVFGTIRSRTEWHISNKERLIAVTKLELFGIDRKSRKVIMPPRVSAFEAKYEEQFALWAGPIKVTKEVSKSKTLLVDFADVERYGNRITKGTQSSVDAPAMDNTNSLIEPAAVSKLRQN